MDENETTYDPSRYDRPSVTADIVIFTLRAKQLQVLLIQRKGWPFAGHWAIPGGFVQMNESLEDAARRELQEETGVQSAYLEQLHAFGDPGRDPRTRVITVAYTALVSSDRLTLRADTDAADADWFPIDALPVPLAFDHDRILSCALRALRRRLEDSNIARELLPARFTLTQLQEVYEALLGRPLDKRNFRKWILTLGLVAPTDQEARGHHRPALLYEFAPPVESGDTSRFLWTRRTRRKEQ
ncbi:MAG: NUDIX hydrolase [Armatimonadetes bacterium]|nr:NUDIX hydrolase [Armatimonadota bacterium]